MATFTHWTETVTREVYSVPATGPYGAAAAEIEKAVIVAANAYRDAYNLPADAPLADNALTFHPMDDTIRIIFTLEEPT